MAIILGEIGSGKTHFAHQFSSSLVEKPKTFFVSCHDEEICQPMQSIINLLRDNFTDEDFEKIDSRWRNPLSLLAPGLIRKNSSYFIPDDASPKENQQSLFEAIYQVLVKICQGKRVVFVFDDIQWIDHDSFEALMYLNNGGFFQKYGFLLLISRIEIVNPKIQFLLTEDDRHNSIQRINIGPLTRQETGMLSHQILGWEPDTEFVHKLHRSTGGNPLLIRETLYSILDTVEDHSSINENTIRFSENLSSIIDEKEEFLDAISKDVLSAAAVCGMDFQFDVLDALNICSKKELVRILEDLEEKQFIHSQKTQEGTGRYSFNQSFYRDSIIKQLSSARYCYLNEQIAFAKVKLKGNQTRRIASTIARHFEIAGKPLQAFEYWIKAAQYARELFSSEEAKKAFAKANQIRLEYSESISEQNLYLLYSEWGDMAYNQMDLASLDECYSAMHEAGEQIDSQLLIGAGLNGLGISAVFKMEIEKALNLLAQGIQIVDKTDNLLEKIQGRFQYGMALSFSGQIEKTIDIDNEAIKLGESVNNQKVRQAVTLVQNYLSLMYAILGQPMNAIEMGKASLRNSFLIVSKPYFQSGAYSTLAIAEYYTGRFSESMNYVRQSKKLVENQRNPRILSLMLILESRLNTLLARMDVGWDLACSALDLATKNNYIENISEAYCVRGDIFLTLHIYDKAIQEYKNGYDTMPGSHSGFDNLYRLGFATAMNGDFDQGLQIINTAIEQADQLHLGSITIPARYLSAQLLESSGNVDEAKLIFDSVIREAESRNYSLVTIPGSIPRLKYLWDNVDNPLAYQVIQNLCDRGIIPQDGIWKEKLLSNVARHQLYSKLFDFDRLTRFLSSLKMNTGS
jgi:tetratricopeptide (TPR) repeat protein